MPRISAQRGYLHRGASEEDVETETTLSVATKRRQFDDDTVEFGFEKDTATRGWGG